MRLCTRRKLDRSVVKSEIRVESAVAVFGMKLSIRSHQMDHHLDTRNASVYAPVMTLATPPPWPPYPYQHGVWPQRLPASGPGGQGCHRARDRRAAHGRGGDQRVAQGQCAARLVAGNNLLLYLPIYSPFRLLARMLITHMPLPLPFPLLSL